MFRKFVYFKTFVFIAVFFTCLSAKSELVKPGIQVDFAQFQAGKDWEYIEVYYSLQRNHLGHTPNGSHYEAIYIFHVQISKDDSIVTEQSWQRLDRVESMNEIKEGQFVYDQVSFFLRPGAFDVKTLLTTPQKDTLFLHKQSVNIKKISKENLAISDIELAVEIKPDTTKHIFNKNNFTVLPNAGGVYGPELPKVLYYSEIYQLSPLSENTDSTYSVTLGVFNEKNILVKTQPKKIRIRASHSLVEYGALNIMELPTGSYNLKIMVKDEASQSEVFKIKKFQVFNPLFSKTRVMHEGNIIRIKTK